MTWLGDIFKQNFIDAWNHLQDTVNDAVNSMGLNWFPATVVRDSLKTLNNVLNDLFEPVIGALGQSIGDRVAGKIEDDLKELRDKIYNEYVSKLEGLISEVERRVDQLEQSVYGNIPFNELQAKLKEILV